MDPSKHINLTTEDARTLTAEEIFTINDVSITLSDFLEWQGFGFETYSDRHMRLLCGGREYMP